MKPYTLFMLFMLASSPIFGQTPVTVQITIHDQYLQNDDEWKSYLTADLFDDNQEVVSPSGSFYYTWQLKVGSGNWYVARSGWGVFNPEFDGHWYESTLAQVTVDVGEDNLQSSQVEIALEYEPTLVFFHPKKQDGSDLTTDGLVLQHWSGGSWTLHQLSASPESDPNSNLFLGIGKSETMKASPAYASSIGQKFQYWQPTASDVINFNSFTIGQSQGPFKSQYRSVVNDATLNVSSVESSSGLTIGLKDPWLVDYQDGDLGYRNRGVSAPFVQHTAGFNPNSNASGSGSEHKGVFTNQDPGQTSVYYSVRAAESQTVNGIPWVFWKWDTSGATLTTPTNLSGGYYESPVIFRPWGTRTVTATYKAHLASNASDVLTLGGQRRLAAGTVSNNTDHLLA